MRNFKGNISYPKKVRLNCFNCLRCLSISVPMYSTSLFVISWQPDMFSRKLLRDMRLLPIADPNKQSPWLFSLRQLKLLLDIKV